MSSSRTYYDGADMRRAPEPSTDPPGMCECGEHSDVHGPRDVTESNIFLGGIRHVLYPSACQVSGCACLKYKRRAWGGLQSPGPSLEHVQSVLCRCANCHVRGKAP